MREPINPDNLICIPRAEYEALRAAAKASAALEADVRCSALDQAIENASCTFSGDAIKQGDPP